MAIEPQRPNTVLVGKKEPIQYVMAIMKIFEDGFEEVVVKARGRNVCKAIEAVEMVKNMFVKDVNIENVKIYSEQLRDDKGKERNVTAIEILLRKGSKG
ncbi:MAG: DNA-binding protein Alba [Desulfurococcales archaeon]|nr:DNA-binding protein Alba [Desulfurococcales archaeon]